MNCHNGEKYLKKSISSVISQNYKNWELIFWNNVSYDKSKKIFKSFKDKRLKYFESKKFQKLYEARNSAIRKAKGKYICFLDTDDWWVNSKLKNQVNFFLKDKDLKFIYSNYYLFNEKKNMFKIFYKDLLPEGNITQKLLNRYCIGVLTVMIKKEIFNNQMFNNNYNIIGDFDFFIRASMLYEIHAINKPLATYRYHGQNLSYRKIDLNLNEFNYWLKKNKSKLTKFNLKNLKWNVFKLKLKKVIKNFDRQIN